MGLATAKPCSYCFIVLHYVQGSCLETNTWKHTSQMCSYENITILAFNRKFKQNSKPNALLAKESYLMMRLLSGALMGSISQILHKSFSLLLALFV